MNKPATMTFATLLTALLCLAGCGSDSSGGSNDKDGTYTNDVVGVTLDLPSSWEEMSKEELESAGVELSDTHQKQAWTRNSPSEMITFEATYDAALEALQILGTDEYLDTYLDALNSMGGTVTDSANDTYSFQLDSAAEKKDLKSGTYIRTEGTYTDEPGYDVDYLTIENGWVIIYEYWTYEGKDSTPNLDDFETMVANAVYSNSGEANDEMDATGEVTEEVTTEMPYAEDDAAEAAGEVAEEAATEMTPAAEESSTSQIPAGAIDWSEAGDHVYETVTVYGKVTSTNYATGSNGKPTFINMGVNYKEDGCVTAVIWDRNRSAFSTAPETAYKDKTICVTGEISLYNGAYQIEVTSPDQIQVIS